MKGDRKNKKYLLYTLKGKFFVGDRADKEW